MKKLLLSVAFLVSLNAAAQTPIGSFYNISLVPEDSNTLHYVLVTSGSPLDQSASGANVAWNFNDLTEVTQTTTTVLIPSNDDIANYPGTTMVVETITEGGNPTHYYLGQSEGTYLTGAETSQMTIAYSDPALIGYFPMNYGASTTDEVAGTFDGQGVSGTFTGTTATSVDGYGTLTVNEGFEGTMNVTRLKTQQDLTLIYMGFPVGTLNQVTYSYYNADISTGPVFRSITTHVVVAALGIDQTQSTLESYSPSANGAENFNAPGKVVIAPNPVGDRLHIAGIDAIESVTIIDAAGRVIEASKGNYISVGHLPAGIYMVTVGSQSGTTSLKMVKQ